MIIDEVSVPFIAEHAFYVAHADMKERGDPRVPLLFYTLLRQRALLI